MQRENEPNINKAAAENLARVLQDADVLDTGVECAAMPHNSSRSVNCLVYQWAEAAAGFGSYLKLPMLPIWGCIVFVVLVFVTLIAIRCSAALGAKLIAFAKYLKRRTFYFKFMNIFSNDSTSVCQRVFYYIDWS